MGTEYPQSKFVGIDIMPYYPSTIKPKNVTFQGINILEGLPFEDNTFDYVYMRFMMVALSHKDRETVIKEIIRVCKPNGWIELMEG